MISATSFHGAFNARWMSPEQVARQFVPISPFNKLVHVRHSLLLGPRGSGKTTLLKMLTRPALQVWKDERQKSGDPPAFERPEFEAIYIPSDIRWSYELRHLETDAGLPELEAELAQRIFVSCTALVAMCDAFEAILPHLSTIDHDEAEAETCESLIDLYGLTDTIPLFRDIRTSADTLAARLRGLLNRRDGDRIKAFLDDASDFLFSHAIDGPVAGCKIFDRYASKGRAAATRWALCFDELEISPSWMQAEILESLRSIDQQFLLKLTYSPILPTDLKSSPEPAQDFQGIRLWHSHVQDARLFCEELTTRFLAEKFPEAKATPDDFLRYSVLASGLGTEPEPPDLYDRGSTFYTQMVELADRDQSFRHLLLSRGIDPSDPYSTDSHLRDTFFRKIKPVVIIRNSFWNPERSRSRKVLTAYAGKEAVYAMSEGNPRWLLGLLTDLYDRWLTVRSTDEDSAYIRYNLQAKVLNATARRYHASLNATPIAEEHDSGATKMSLIGLVDAVGEAIANGLLAPTFPLDPSGSFLVEIPPPRALDYLVRKGLETGALVYIGSSEEDVPREIGGSRFRLSFMLAPVYKLPFRNYRPIHLSTLLSRSSHPGQMGVFDAQ